MHKGDELGVFIQFLCTDKYEHLHSISMQAVKLKLEPRRKSLCNYCRTSLIDKYDLNEVVSYRTVRHFHVQSISETTQFLRLNLRRSGAEF